MATSCDFGICNKCIIKVAAETSQIGIKERGYDNTNNRRNRSFGF